MVYSVVSSPQSVASRPNSQETKRAGRSLTHKSGPWWREDPRSTLSCSKVGSSWLSSSVGIRQSLNLRRTQYIRSCSRRCTSRALCHPSTDWIRRWLASVLQVLPRKSLIEGAGMIAGRYSAMKGVESTQETKVTMDEKCRNDSSSPHSRISVTVWSGKGIWMSGSTGYLGLPRSFIREGTAWTGLIIKDDRDGTYPKGCYMKNSSSS